MANLFFFVSFRTLSSSDDVQDRETEKSRLEEAYEKCDRDLDQLIVQHYTELTTAIRTYQSITERITSSRNKIKQVKHKDAVPPSLPVWLPVFHTLNRREKKHPRNGSRWQENSNNHSTAVLSWKASWHDQPSGGWARTAEERIGGSIWGSLLEKVQRSLLFSSPQVSRVVI